MKDSSGLYKNHNSVLVGYMIGTISTIVITGLYDWLYLNRTNKIKNTSEGTNSIDRTNAGATIEGNDLSLFYGNEQQLTTISTQQQTFLPNEIYSTIVLNTVICCVDILLVHTNTTTTATKTKHALLVLRNSEPAKNFWWLPGGRLLKGETFFTAAIRKAKEETGIIDSNIQPIQILGVWNTFFPTSNWDTTDQCGTQTVNPIVLVEINATTSTSTTSNDNNNTTIPKIQLDETSTSYRWITVDPKDNTTEDKYIQQALLRLQQWNPSYIQYK